MLWKSSHHGRLVLNTLVMGCGEQGVTNAISTCCIIAISCIISKYCGRVRVAPVNASPHMSAGGLSFLQEDGQEQGQKKRSYSILWERWAWQSLLDSIPYPAIIMKSRRKDAILASCYSEFPFPVVASGCFCLSQHYEVYHHEGSLLATTVSSKRHRTVVVGARRAIFLPGSVQRALSGLDFGLSVAHSSDGESVEGMWRIHSPQIRTKQLLPALPFALTGMCCRSWWWSLGW